MHRRRQMMMSLSKGRYQARVALTPQDLSAAQALRAQAFETGKPVDSDPFDAACTHFLIEDKKTGALACCFRILTLATGREVAQSYAAQFYDLSGLHGFSGPLIEMGRFCMDPKCHDPDVLRVAWAALTRHVDENKVEMLFGCSSFPGIDPVRYQDTFGLLHQRHLAPTNWTPKIKSSEVIRFGDLGPRDPNIKTALLQLPPLLRSYLTMGGRVSDHAVVDRKMNTLHVFTGVEVVQIPPARKRLLRALAG